MGKGRLLLLLLPLYGSCGPQLVPEGLTNAPSFPHRLCPSLCPAARPGQEVLPTPEHCRDPLPGPRPSQHPAPPFNRAEPGRVAVSTRGHRGGSSWRGRRSAAAQSSGGSSAAGPRDTPSLTEVPVRPGAGGGSSGRGAAAAWVSVLSCLADER